MTLALNPALDVAGLARDYAASGRMQVRELLTEPAAETILGWLEALPWGLAFNDGEKVNELSLEQAQALSVDQQRQIQQRVYENAQKQYQFLYNYWPLFANYFAPDRPASPLYEAYEFLNSASFLDFVRTLTGRPEIKWADAHATLFRAGHFLKYHNDEKPQDRRVAAYVMNFTKGWGRDWGGFLQFWNQDYDVELAYRPVFNALNIFTIPADHSVNVVAPYAPGLRFSITGWLRADDPPAPIGGR